MSLVRHRFEHKPEIIVGMETEVVAVAPFLRSLAFRFGQWFGFMHASALFSALVRGLRLFRVRALLNLIEDSDYTLKPNTFFAVEIEQAEIATDFNISFAEWNPPAGQLRHSNNYLSACARRQASPVLDVPGKRQNRIEDFLCACA